MTSRNSKTEVTIPKLYTVKEVMRRTGLSAPGVSHRMAAREFKLGPYLRPAGGYLFTEAQVDGLCEDWGKGQDAVEEHAKKRHESHPRRRKAS